MNIRSLLLTAAAAVLIPVAAAGQGGFNNQPLPPDVRQPFFVTGLGQLPTIGTTVIVPGIPANYVLVRVQVNSTDQYLGQRYFRGELVWLINRF